MSIEKSAPKLIGANFSLYPMCDNYVDVIMDALKETDTSKVSMETDDVSTVMRGKPIHIFDVTEAILAHASMTGEHVGLQASYIFSEVGNDKDSPYIKVDDVRMNGHITGGEQLFAAAKFSLYPLGRESYIDIVLEQIEQIKEHTDVIIKPFATKLEGNLSNIFTGLESVFKATLDTGIKHVVMQVNFSMNSPSHITGGRK